eukprot:1824672-Pleurochrysis_carterae.AAC.1
MGMLDINKDINLIYFDEISHNIEPLRPSRIIYTVLQVNIKRYWSNSGLGWETQYRKQHDRKCAMALFMFIAGSVDSLATNMQAQRAYTHLTCNLPVRRVLIYDARQYVNMEGT